MTETPLDSVYASFARTLDPVMHLVAESCAVPHWVDLPLASRLCQAIGVDGEAGARAVARLRNHALVYPYGSDGWRLAPGLRSYFVTQAYRAGRLTEISDVLVREMDARVGNVDRHSLSGRECRWRAAFHKVPLSPSDALARLDEFLNVSEPVRGLAKFKAAVDLCDEQSRWLGAYESDQLYYRGLYYYEKRDFAMAESILSRVWDGGGRGSRRLTAGHLVAAIWRRKGGASLVAAESRLRDVLELSLVQGNYLSACHIMNTLSATLRSLGGQKRLGEAEQLCRRAMKLAKRFHYDLVWARSAISLAVVLMDIDHKVNKSEAERLLAEALKLAEFYDATNTIAAAFSTRGLMRGRSGDIDGGIEDFEAAVFEMPDMAEYRVQLALLLLKRGPSHFQQALENLERARSISPEDRSIESHLRRARVNLKATQALEMHRDEALLTNDIEEVWNLGKALERNNRSAEALRCYRHVLALGDERPVVLARIGSILARMGSMEEAILHLENAYAKGLRDLATLRSLARALHRGGRPEAAGKFFLAALKKERYKKDPMLRNWYGLWLLDQGEYDQAEAYLRDALDIQPDNPFFLNDVALLIIETKAVEKYEEAEILLRKAVGLAKEGFVWPAVNLKRLLELRRSDFLE